MSSRARLGAAIVAATVLLVFGPMVLRCGLYQDDYSMILALKDTAPAQLWQNFLTYVPGRNLHILFMSGLYKLTGAAPLGLHAVSLAVDLFSILLVYLLIIQWTALTSLALPAALLFALMPHHGETHFWSVQFAQCQLAPLFALLALYAATRPDRSQSARTTFALALYTIGFFTYDQVFFLWPLILLAAWFASVKNPRLMPMLLGSLYGLSLNASFLLLRYLSPSASGGRPTIQLGMILDHMRESVKASLKAIASVPTSGALPHWIWTVLLAIAAIFASILILRFWTRTAKEERTELDRWLETPSPLRWMLFGAAWFFLAYLPNYFWFMSPRHNYLPSFGWTILWVAAVGAAARAYPRLRRVLPAVCVLLAGNAMVANIHEGSEWVRSGQLQRAYLTEAKRLDESVEGVFTIGAPQRVRRAPAFQLHHDAALSAAMARSLPNLEGDIQLTPTWRGALYFNNLSNMDRTSFRWMPYDRVGAVAYSETQGFHCVETLELEGVDGRTRTAPLRAARDCSETLRMKMDVSLVSARRVRRGKSPGRPITAGLAAAAPELSVKPDRIRLAWTWLVDKAPGGRIAVIPSLLSVSGEVLFEPVYRSRTHQNRTMLLWPLHNDELPPMRWRPGDAVREVWDLRLERPLPAGACRLRLKAYTLRERNLPELLGTAEFKFAACGR